MPKRRHDIRSREILNERSGGTRLFAAREAGDGKKRVVLYRIWQRPDKVDRWDRNDFADLIESNLDVAACDSAKSRSAPSFRALLAISARGKTGCSKRVL